MRPPRLRCTTRWCAPPGRTWISPSPSSIGVAARRARRCASWRRPSACVATTLALRACARSRRRDKERLPLRARIADRGSGIADRGSRIRQLPATSSTAVHVTQEVDRCSCRTLSGSHNRGLHARPGTRHATATRVAPRRLTGWDYSANGAYFLTICTSQRVRAFGDVQTDGIHLSVLGTVVAQQLLEITRGRPGLCLDVWVIMPDHVHLIVVYEGHPENRVPVDLLVAELKATVTWAARRMGVLATRQPLWQRGFHDRVVRDEGELRQLREYIVTNPCRWMRSGR